MQVLLDFETVAQRFAQAEPGTDAFKEFFRNAYHLMKLDPENAALYFIVGVAAHAYSTTYEDQGVSPETAENAKSILQGYNAKIVQGLQADAQSKMRLLNEVALHYEWQVTNF